MLVTDLYVRVQQTPICRVEVILGQVDQQLDLMQVYDLVKLYRLKTQETLKRSFVLFSLQIFLVDSHQLEELQMPTILPPHWRCYHFI